MSGITADRALVTTIRVAAGAPAPVVFAAHELQRYLAMAVGAALPVEEGGAGRGACYVGVESGAVLGSVGFDRAAVAVIDGGVRLVGENPRSALYAVYDFLRDFLDVRFWGPGEAFEDVPARPALELPGGLARPWSSAFALRDYAYGEPGAIDFAMKNRLNTITMVGEYNAAAAVHVRRRGGLIRGPGHIWREFVPGPELLAEHPEYFPMIDGRRQHNGRTACFSNAGARRVFFDKLRAYLRATPDWDIFAFWAEDTADPFYCGCPECAKRPLAEWYIDLVNEAARIVDEELPSAEFEFIAYHGTRRAPASRPPLYRNGEKMLLDLCLGYTRDIFAPLADRTHGSAEVEDMYRSWLDYLQAVGFRGRTLLMEYYNLCELPNQGPRGRALLWPLDVIRTDTRRYRADGIDGLSDWVCFGRLCWPIPLYLWAWLRLYTDPELRIEDLKADFFARYFGSAGAAARGYVEALEAAMHERVSADNVAQVAELGRLLDGLSAADARVQRRLAILRAHHAYCVLLKRIYLAAATGDEAGWRALETPFRAYFERTYRGVLEGAVDIPPTWAYTWYDWSPSAKQFAEARVSQAMLR